MDALQNITGRPIALPGFRCSVYFDGMLGDPAVSAACAAIFDEIVSRFGGQFAYVVREGAVAPQKSPAQLDRPQVEACHTWIAHPHAALSASLRMNGVSSPEPAGLGDGYVGLPYFRIDQKRGHAVLDYAVPLEGSEAATLGKAVLAALSAAPVNCGVLGMGFYLPRALDSLIRNLPMAFRRYRCAIETQFGKAEDGISEENSVFRFEKFPRQKPGIVDIGWITIVGARFLDRVPPLSEAGLPPDVTVTDLARARAYIAGPVPIWGDINLAEDCSAYRAVAQHLRAVRFPIDPALRFLFGAQWNVPEGKDRVEAYLARLDDQPFTPGKDGGHIP